MFFSSFQHEFSPCLSCATQLSLILTWQEMHTRFVAHWALRWTIRRRLIPFVTSSQPFSFGHSRLSNDVVYKLFLCLKRYDVWNGFKSSAVNMKFGVPKGRCWGLCILSFLLMALILRYNPKFAFLQMTALFIKKKYIATDNDWQILHEDLHSIAG